MNGELGPIATTGSTNTGAFPFDATMNGRPVPEALRHRILRLHDEPPYHSPAEISAMIGRTACVVSRAITDEYRARAAAASDLERYRHLRSDQVTISHVEARR